ncbi:PPK2 family polyphosphate kinase [Rubritalea tangerina]
MLIDEASTRYRVEPGQVIDLNMLDSSDKGLWVSGVKAEHSDLLHEKLAELKALQNQLFAEGKHKVLVVIQAMDAGGKDGCAKKVFSSMDPQGVHVKAFKAPHEEELSYDFLWRIHKAVPQKGMIAVFNRSHYEDIIAVRVKRLFPEQVWKNRYRHVIDFEKMLADEGTKIVKIFLNISKEEQGERLQARLDDPAKLWKFEPEDLADRKRWGEFMEAYSDLLSRTSTDYAPWHIVPADRKWYRNLVVAQIMINALRELDMKFPEVKWKPEDMVIE